MHQCFKAPFPLLSLHPLLSSSTSFPPFLFASLLSSFHLIFSAPLRNKVWSIYISPGWIPIPQQGQGWFYSQWWYFFVPSLWIKIFLKKSRVKVESKWVKHALKLNPGIVSAKFIAAGPKMGTVIRLLQLPRWISFPQTWVSTDSPQPGFLNLSWPCFTVCPTGPPELHHRIFNAFIFRSQCQ